MSPEHRQSLALASPERSCTASVREYVDRAVQELLAILPDPNDLSPTERRGIIARYAAVLEGNFIYWMTGAYLAVASDEARSIIRDNLSEEVRDNHPGMLRRFALAAHAMPTDADACAVHRDLENVRRFVGRLAARELVLMMAFFEDFITRFMPYLAELARRRGSAEQRYTDVHGVVDVVHSQELFRAFDAELRLAPAAPGDDIRLLEGVDLLRALLHGIIHPVLPPRHGYGAAPPDGATSSDRLEGPSHEALAGRG